MDVLWPKAKELDDNDKLILRLKMRIEELKDVIKEHGKVLDSYNKIYSPYVDRDIEVMKGLREKVLTDGPEKLPI